MPRQPSKTFTDKELEIMRVIERKGHLIHRAEGKAHIYRAKAKPGKAQRRVLSHLIEQLFGGSAAAMVLHLVETGDLTEEDLSEIREQMAARAQAGKTAAAKPKKGGKK
jgi:predicted transcriptional regulator